MGRDLGMGILLFALAGLLFLLPGNLLRDCRLRIYSLWSESEQKAEAFSPNPAVLTPVVAPEIRLRELTQQLIQKDGEIAALRRELRNLGGLRANFPLTRIVPARVLGLGGSNEAPEAYLSAGADDGVETDHLLTQGAAFAGVVVGTGNRAALALLPTHPGCVVGGRATLSRDICSVRGLGAGKAQAVFYTGQTAAAPGEKILTSGLTGKAPEGLVIGTLEDYPHRGREPGTLEAPIRLEADLCKLDDVLILGGEGLPVRSAVSHPSAQPGDLRPSSPVNPLTPAAPVAPRLHSVPVKPSVPSTPDRPADDGSSPALG